MTDRRQFLTMSFTFSWHVFTEQCSAINRLSIASDLQLSTSGVCNSKLCYLHFEARKVFVSLIWVLIASSMPLNFTMFRYDCIIAKFAMDFSWISSTGTEPSFKFWILQTYLTKLLTKQYCFGFPGAFFARDYYLVS